MGDKRSIGYEHVLVADVRSDGNMPLLADMDEIAIIVEESGVVITKEDDTLTPFNAGETGKADTEIISAIGGKVAVFATWDYVIENIIRAFGGSQNGAKWQEPVNSFGGRELALKIIGMSVNGMHNVRDFPRTKMTAKELADLNRTTTGAIQYSMKVLTPNDEATGLDKTAYENYFKPQQPPFGVVDDAGDEFLFEVIPNFSDVTLYEYSTDSGVTWTDVSVNPITGITTAVGVGELHVRVKAVTTGVAKDRYESGFSLLNTVEFTA